MIKFQNLLQNHGNFSTFWKTVLERLSIEDAPFFSSIQENQFHIDEKVGIDLRESQPETVVSYCRENWQIPIPFNTWKDIKKETTRISLLRRYSSLISSSELEANNFFIELQILLNQKVICSDNITIEGGEISRIDVPLSSL